MRFGLKLAQRLGELSKTVGHCLMKTPSYSSITGMSLRARLYRWWSTNGAPRSGSFFIKGAFGAVCFMAVAIGMAVVSTANNSRQDDQQFRERNVRLAKAQDAGEVLRADKDAASLLQHDWLRNVEYSLERDPASALSRYAAYERDRAALDGLESFQTGHMAQADKLVAESKCLAQAIYYEARSEKLSGQLAVAEVIMNRVADHRYPNSVCDVVFQGATRTTGCQFTFTCDGALRKHPRGARWETATTIASHVMMGLNEKKTSGATHYHATYVNPVWNSGLVKTRQIGTHIFYRFPRGGEWTTARARMSARTAKREAGLSALQPVSVKVVAKPAKALKTVGTGGAAILKKDDGFVAEQTSEAEAETVTVEPAAKVVEADTLEVEPVVAAPVVTKKETVPVPLSTAALEAKSAAPAG